ncbi:hypothetical protein MBOT_02940 [Mycobacterium botniense]|uniref:Uncharacterized protein n=1 Tax=Mycobacterium botniense TaxID=84962 RepID=A0A7I9XSF5_9MYCO|nr:hypothetical protein MBOT_02940 [Mycobacterium botniense]
MRADHHVRGHLRGRIVSGKRQHPQCLPEGYGGLMGHPGELTAPDHGDHRPAATTARHGTYGVMAAERGIYRQSHRCGAPLNASPYTAKLCPLPMPLLRCFHGTFGPIWNAITN